ncbi:hypothetical protein GMOD_00007947 [Pyrenophora seminiperda CCB06]|uniref:Uncharacterized protein n=1 Tax=Pyrenophora seminiperda CCB06 TaxID=1302712 RepID=A0A3M7MGE9_9PLEO|nr:hypothetical protein GMOD_00007947 [Pyrenophora seminiperda CCB06]
MVARYALVATTIATFVAASTAQFLTSDDDYFYTTTRRATPTSAYWTYTSRFVDQASESPYTYNDGSVTVDTYTITATIKDGVTPTATPYSVYTSRDYYYSNLQIVEAYYASDAVASSDIVPETYLLHGLTATFSATTTTVTSIDFSMPVTMTAPASCPTPFTVTLSASVDVPSQVTAQIKPTSVETSSSTTTYGHTVYMYETWYLSANAAPFTSSSNYYYSYYIADCSTPPAPRRTGSTHLTGVGGGGSGSSRNDDSSSSDSDDVCYSYYCHTSIWTWVIIIATVIPGLFLLGFLESWFWFRRLMMGKSAMRFGTVCWVFISLWVLCFTRMQDRRSAEDQKLLAQKWKEMSRGKAFKAWMKWGFRHRYPEELLGQFSSTTVGIVPPGQASQAAMAQSGGAPGALGQVYYYGPPPPGWVQAPNGGFVPPQGYVYPAPQQSGYYGDATKDGGMVSQQQMQNVSPMVPQAPQPVYTASGALPAVGPTPASSEPTPTAAPSPPPQAARQGAPQIPPIRINNSPVADNTPAPPSTRNETER